jgi:nitroreductase
MWKLIRPYIRNLYRFFFVYLYFFYDYIRYIKYSGYKSNFNDNEVRNYYAVMIYHGLEKSLSYKKRKHSSGWKNAYKLLESLKYAEQNHNFGYHDRAAIQILEKFISLPENINDKRSLEIKNKLKKYKKYISHDNHGIIEYTYNDFKKGILKNPEEFFYSRYSLREFKDEPVKEEEIERAVKLAMKTPSVCNRQAWGVYYTSEQQIKDLVLEHQEGNKPFGRKIPTLIIVTADLKAFFSPEERYQYWIDGGMFSMSLIYAFHSLGIATCPLNWSSSPKKDLELRKKINIRDNHTIIMLIAVGYPNEINRVCASARRPLKEIFYKLELK